MNTDLKPFEIKDFSKYKDLAKKQLLQGAF